MATNSSILFLSVLNSGTGFDLQKCEYSSANEACSKVTSMQVELSIHEVLVATKYSKVDTLGILHSVSNNQCSGSQLFWNNTCKLCLPVLLILNFHQFYFPTGYFPCSPPHLYHQHLTSWKDHSSLRPGNVNGAITAAKQGRWSYSHCWRHGCVGYSSCNHQCKAYEKVVNSGSDRSSRHKDKHFTLEDKVLRTNIFRQAIKDMTL